LEEPALVETMLQRLELYCGSDPVPHVRKLVRRIGELMSAYQT
jgi:hypothetical protein